MEHARCTHCGSEDIYFDVRILDKTDSEAQDELEVVIQENPGGLYFRGPHNLPVVADACATCGHLMLRISDMTKLTYVREKAAGRT